MNTRLAAPTGALVGTAMLALAACSSSSAPTGGDRSSRATSSSRSGQSQTAVDCHDPTLSMEQYTKYCMPSQTASSGDGALSSLRFGATAPISTGEGVGALTVSTPKLMTFHDVEYDTSAPNDSAEGPVQSRLIVLTISGKGTSGRFDFSSGVEYEWQDSDGTVRREDLPVSTYEDTNPYTNSTTSLLPGQKSEGGQIYMDSTDIKGKFIALVDNYPIAEWSAK